MRPFSLYIVGFLTWCFFFPMNISHAGNNSGQAFSTWPDTGQTKCYDAAEKIAIACPAEGQPLHGQDAQYQGPARSYTDLGNGTVRDNVTGLVWEQKTNMDNVTNYANPHDADNKYTWCDQNVETNGGYQGTCANNDTTDFITALNVANFGGYNDWRLPTISEMVTLNDNSRVNPAIDLIFAATTKSFLYWSSTTYASDKFWAWISADSTSGSGIGGTYKSNYLYVRAVRGGQSPVGNRFVDNSDGTVTDTVTCLQWQKATMDTTGDGVPDSLNWQQALAVAEGLILAGKSDWRLPDINELYSLVDFSRNAPAIDPVFAETTIIASSYWSSTTAASDAFSARHVFFGDPSTILPPSMKSGTKYVRAVHGIQCGPKWTPPAPTGRIFNRPMTGPPGTIFTQGGTGFRPNSTVTLHFRDLLGQELPVVQRATDATGAFSLTYTAPQDKPFGTYTWWAVDDATGGMSERIGYLIVSPGVSTGIPQGSCTVLPSIAVRNSYGTLESEGTFDTTKETFVIVHGWNLPFFPTSRPEWMTKMGEEIKKKGANVLYWNWQEKARTKVADKVWNGKNDQSCYDISLPVAMVYPLNEITDPGQMIEIPYDETKDSGSHLTAALNGALKDIAYNQPIHFVGHSLGTLVSTYAIQRAHKNGLPWAGLINHLVFLDSPCYGGVPGGNFLHDKKDTIFWENYMSQVGRPYKDADVDVWLQKSIGLNPLDNFSAHAYAHEWYWSSVTNFSDRIILGDSSTPASTLPYGFYWWKTANRVDIASDYSQIKMLPHYVLEKGNAWDNKWDLPKAIVIDLTNAYTGATVEMAEQIAEWAKTTGHVVKIVGISAFNTVADVANYVVDTAGHAVLDSFFGSVTLTHASTSVLDLPVAVPAEANVLTFGLDFLYGESGSLLEVFINGQPVQHINSDEALGESLRMIPWINVEQYAGQVITLSLRISNPNEGTEGKIRLDDLIVAKIEDPAVLAGDFNNDSLIDLRDVILGLQISSGIEPNNKLYLAADVDGDGKIGLAEVIYCLQKAAGML